MITYSLYCLYSTCFTLFNSFNRFLFLILSAGTYKAQRTDSRKEPLEVVFSVRPPPQIFLDDHLQLLKGIKLPYEICNSCTS